MNRLPTRTQLCVVNVLTAQKIAADPPLSYDSVFYYRTKKIIKKGFARNKNTEQTLRYTSSPLTGFNCFFFIIIIITCDLDSLVSLLRFFHELTPSTPTIHHAASRCS